MYSRIDVHLWVIDQCHAKSWGPCISTGSYRPKVYLWFSEAYWRELPCACGSKRPRLAVPEISANQCPALINWYLNEYWLLWHILGIVRKVFLRAFRRILDRGNRVSIRGVMAEWSLWQKYKVSGPAGQSRIPLRGYEVKMRRTRQSSLYELLSYLYKYMWLC